MSATKVPDLRISLALRAWLAVEVLFGVLSLVTISLTPANTASHFAWPIKPEVTAALLGGFYIAAASFYVLALFARRWQNIRVFIIASILFSSIELASTFLHWDRFSVGTTPFNVWFVSYALPPPLFIAFYLWHERRALPIPLADDEPLPAALRLALLVLGAAAVVFGLLAFVFPATVIPLMPWQFSALTMRALSGWILACGVMLASAARENDRTRCRIISPFFILALPAIALEVARYPEQVNWAHPAVYVGATVLVLLFAIGLILARGDWRRTMR
ncbi:hypothetical protein BH10PSE9_BH10PSE9_23060 [soil metagenome]